MNQSDTLKEMTDDQLASWQAGWKERTSNDILAEKEWQRRFMAAQHDHDRQMLRPQIKWMKISVITGFIGALIGAILTLAATSLKSSSATDAEDAAIQALAQRESALVLHLFPKANEIAKDLLGTNAPYTEQPTTIEELMTPFAKIISALGEPSSEQGAGGYGSPAAGSPSPQP